MRVLISLLILTFTSGDLLGADPRCEPLMIDKQAEARQFVRQERRAMLIRLLQRDREIEAREREERHKALALWVACPEIQVVRLLLGQSTSRNFDGNVLGLQVPGDPENGAQMSGHVYRLPR
jgi:hypothetical protein